MDIRKMARIAVAAMMIGGCCGGGGGADAQHDAGPDTGTSCEDECPGVGTQCFAGQCMPLCGSDEECNDALDGSVCDFGRCYATCSTTFNCQYGFVCTQTEEDTIMTCRRGQ